MGNEKFASKGIKCLEEVSQAKRKNNATSKKCKIICQREDICKRAPGAGGGLARRFSRVTKFQGKGKRGSTGISCQVSNSELGGERVEPS